MTTNYSDGVASVEALITSTSLCTECLVTTSGLPAPEVEIALRVLIRTKSAAPAEACDSCESERPAFKATIEAEPPP